MILPVVTVILLVIFLDQRFMAGLGWPLSTVFMAIRGLLRQNSDSQIQIVRKFHPGRKSADVYIHMHVNDGNKFGTVFYKKVNEKIETSINLVWTAGQ